MRPSKDHSTPHKHHSVVEIIPNSTLQLRRTLAEHARQVFQVIASSDAEFAHEVLCGSLQIAVVLDATRTRFVFRTTEVGVGRNGLCALEALQTCLGLGLCGWVEGAFAEELVGGDTFLNAELFAGVALGVVWGELVSDLSPETMKSIVLSS